MKKILNKSLFSTILAVLLALPLSITPVAADDNTATIFARTVYQGVSISNGTAAITDVTDDALKTAVANKIQAQDLSAGTFSQFRPDLNATTVENIRAGGPDVYNAVFKLSNGSGDVTVKLPPGNSKYYKDLSGDYVLVSTYANGTWTPQVVSIVDNNQSITVPYVNADLYLVSQTSIDTYNISQQSDLKFTYPVKTTGAALSPSVDEIAQVTVADGVNVPANVSLSVQIPDDAASGNVTSFKNAATKLGLPPTQSATFKFAVKVTAYNADTKELTLDITPTYSVIDATTGKKVSEGNNADVLKNSTDPIKITFSAGELAKGLNKMYVKHVKDDGKTYVYTASVDEYGWVTFTDYHGFSSFTLSKDVPAGIVAFDNNGTGYTTLQDAVDSVPNGGTITLADANAALSAVVNREVTFTLSGANVKITAGNGYQLTKNGDVYTVTKTPAKATSKKAAPNTGVVLE